MAAYHIACWNKVNGVNKTGFRAQFASSCSAARIGQCVVPGGKINVGDLIWGVKETAPIADQATSSGKSIAQLVQEKLEQQQLQAQRDTMLGPEVTPDPDSELPPPPPVPGLTGALDIQQAVAMLKPIIDSLIDRKVKAALDAAPSVKVIEIQNLDTTEIIKLGIQHKQFPLLLKCIQARVNVWLAGPSGSGKTTAAKMVAKALNLPFYLTGAVNDQYALTGYKNASGDYVRTLLREAWEHGGVFLWDEVDASDPNALVAFNDLLTTEIAAFPDGMIPKHPDCILIAAANTWGHGATHEYVGRLKMDMAFLKRFVFIAWEYDDQMEWNTAPNRMWTKRVQEVRKRVMAKGLRVLVTPRESYIGAKLLAAGIEQPIVEQMTIKSGMTDDQWRQVAS